MIITIQAISAKGKSRTGKQPVAVVVEQDKGDRLFVAVPPTAACGSESFRWIQRDNDPDFRIL
jgi:hypothetical protein